MMDTRFAPASTWDPDVVKSGPWQAHTPALNKRMVQGQTCVVCSKNAWAEHLLSKDRIMGTLQLWAVDCLLGKAEEPGLRNLVAAASGGFRPPAEVPVTQQGMMNFWGEEVAELGKKMAEMHKARGLVRVAVQSPTGKDMKVEILPKHVKSYVVKAVSYPGTGKYEKPENIAIRFSDLPESIHTTIGHDHAQEALQELPEGWGWWPSPIAIG
jgi:hypothetical protein